jgi:hypothetical protein
MYPAAMENKKRRIVGATAMSAAAMASMLGVAAPAHADTAGSSTQLPAVQNTLLKVENTLLKLDGAFLKAGTPTAGVDNAFHKIESIFFKFGGTPS